MSNWILYPLIFAAGWIGCWYLSKAMLRHVFRVEDSLSKEVIQGLSQRSLLSLHRAVEAELALRREGPNEQSAA